MLAQKSVFWFRGDVVKKDDEEEVEVRMCWEKSKGAPGSLMGRGR
jgi:hypothetical protein